jgi:hypothetical protein
LALVPLRRRLLPLLLLPALAGCGGGGGATVALPVKHSQLPAASPAAAAGPQSTQDQIITAYTGYWQAYVAATRTKSVKAATALLARYSDPALLRSLVGPLPKLWASHYTTFGYAVPHVLGVRPGSAKAVLHDCLDTSHFGTQNELTGRQFPGGITQARVNFYVTLVRSGSRWLVSKFTKVEVPCVP